MKAIVTICDSLAAAGLRAVDLPRLAAVAL
jgi:hypothetical protein